MEQNIKLSKRLKCVADMVTAGARVADIGTDHGFVPIYLIKSRQARHVIAMDIRKGPLKSAMKHIEEYKLENHIETRLSDGTQKLTSGEADTVIISGMGGELIIHILENAKPLYSDINEWILSPQSEHCKVRHYLSENGFMIVDEQMVFDDGKYYVIIKAIQGNMNYQKNIYYQYGKLLIERKDSVLKEFLIHEKTLLYNIKAALTGQESNKVSLRLEEIEKKIMAIEEVEHEMQ